MPRMPLLLVACAPLAWPQISSLPSRESLSYTIEWRLITAGKAHIDWSAKTPARNGYDLKLRLESAGLVSKFFKVEDDYSVSLTRELCAQSSFMDSTEGRRHHDTRVTFDYETRKAAYLERDLARNNAVLGQQEVEIPACVHDIAGGLYFLRTLRLEPGQHTQAPVSDGKKSVMAGVEGQQREEIKTPAGTFKTVRYEVFLFNNVLYRRSAHAYVWLTDDARRLPVQVRVRMQFTIGTITMQLDKVP